MRQLLGLSLILLFGCTPPPQKPITIDQPVHVVCPDTIQYPIPASLLPCFTPGAYDWDLGCGCYTAAYLNPDSTIDIDPVAKNIRWVIGVPPLNFFADTSKDINKADLNRDGRLNITDIMAWVYWAFINPGIWPVLTR